MRRPIDQFDIQNPNRILSKLINDYVEGRLDDHRVLFRASVVAVDLVGGQFESDPPNPKNSIRARIITDGIDANTSDSDLLVFWPLFPYHNQPIKEKEHVYVIFEDDRREVGLWITRIPEPLNVANANFVAGTAKYLQRADNELTNISAERAVQGLLTDPTGVDLSPEFVVEEVPSFSPRVGDHVMEGSNNTLIALGRDRPGAKDTGEQNGAGTIDIVAGRATPDNPDLANDKARVYITALSDVDTNFNTASVGQTAGPVAAVVAKGDHIRIIARAGTKIVVEGGDLVLEGANIFIGNNAAEPAVLGEQLKTFLASFLDAFRGTLTVAATAMGPAPLDPIVKQRLDALAAQLNNWSGLSQTVKVKP